MAASQPVVGILSPHAEVFRPAQATGEAAVCVDPASTPPVPAGNQATEPAVRFDPASTPPVPAKDQAADLAPDAVAVKEPALALPEKLEARPQRNLRPSPTLSLSQALQT